MFQSCSPVGPMYLAWIKLSVGKQQQQHKAAKFEVGCDLKVSRSQSAEPTRECTAVLPSPVCLSCLCLHVLL